MGFLDNTTNNIILDAVLTDVGRRILAEGRGSFSVFKFALGDDDVNYSLVSKFGRTTGKEKIEKNTPDQSAGGNSRKPKRAPTIKKSRYDYLQSLLKIASFISNTANLPFQTPFQSVN